MVKRGYPWAWGRWARAVIISIIRCSWYYILIGTMCLYACVHAKLLQSCLTLVTLWTVACQAPLSLGFSRQEYWSGLPCPPAGDLPDPGIEPGSFIFLMSAGGFFTSEPPRKLLQRGLMGQNPGALNAVTKDQVLHWLWFPDGDTSHSYPQWVVWESKKWKQKSFKF